MNVQERLCMLKRHVKYFIEILEKFIMKAFKHIK